MLILCIYQMDLISKIYDVFSFEIDMVEYDED